METFLPSHSVWPPKRKPLNSMFYVIAAKNVQVACAVMLACAFVASHNLTQWPMMSWENILCGAERKHLTQRASSLCVCDHSRLPPPFSLKLHLLFPALLPYVMSSQRCRLSLLSFSPQKKGGEARASLMTSTFRQLSTWVHGSAGMKLQQVPHFCSSDSQL